MESEPKKSKLKLPKVTIKRQCKPGEYLFTEVFSGIDTLPIIKKVFGSKTKQVFKTLKIRISKGSWGYAYIDDKKGMIVIKEHYFRTGSDAYLCLDMIHELVHIRQYMEGKELFDKKYSYTERPTEIEAYKVAAKEAAKIGMSKREMVKYLEVDWVSKEESDALLAKILKDI